MASKQSTSKSKSKSKTKTAKATKTLGKAGGGGGFGMKVKKNNEGVSLKGIWSEEEVIEGTRKWVKKFILQHSVCPLAVLPLTRIVVSHETEALGPYEVVSQGHMIRTTSSRGSYQPYLGLDIEMLQREARDLLASDRPLKSSTIVAQPYSSELDNYLVEFEKDIENRGPTGFQKYRQFMMQMNQLMSDILPLGCRPIVFYPSNILHLDMQGFPWFCVQLFRQADLDATRDEWCKMQGVENKEGFLLETSWGSTNWQRRVVPAGVELMELFCDLRRDVMPSSLPTRQSWLEAAHETLVKFDASEEPPSVTKCPMHD